MQQVVVDALFRDVSLTRQALFSYDDFVSRIIPNVVNNHRPVSVKADLSCFDDSTPPHVIRIDSVRYGPPSCMEKNGDQRLCTPMEARVRDLMYSAPMYVKVHYEHGVDGQSVTQTFNDVFFARMPVMVRSSLCSLKSGDHGDDYAKDECPHAPGGYFIVNGREKTLVVQERISPNIIFCFSASDCLYHAEYDTVAHRVSTLRIKVRKFGSSPFVVHLPGMETAIPILILWQALGGEEEEYLLHLDASDVRTSEEDASVVDSQASAMEWLGRYCEDPVLLLERRVYPNIAKAMKCTQLILQWKTYLDCLHERIPYHDRDHVRAKRLDTAGAMLGTMFVHLFYQMLGNIRKMAVVLLNKNKKLRPHRLIQPQHITDGIKYALATGNWKIKNSAFAGRVGVSQLLNRNTYISCISQLRRVDTGIDSQQKIIAPRLLYGNQWGYMCPTETPEGGPCGLVKQLSLSAYITTQCDYKPIEAIIQPVLEKTASHLVFHNGAPIGAVCDVQALTERLRAARRSRVVSSDACVATEEGNLYIWTDSGRVSRPVFVVRRGKLLITNDQILDLKDGRLRWDDLFSLGIVENLSVYEEEAALIALRPEGLTSKHSHCELDPALILGTLASTIPYPDHNQSPRNVYQCLDSYTDVLMHDGSTKMIKDIRIGDLVQSFNPETMKVHSTRVIAQKTSPTTKEMFRITTASGHSILATFDHKFMTDDGWKEVQNLKGHCVAISPYQMPMSVQVPEYDILELSTFGDSLEGQVKSTDIGRYRKILINMGLLPLRSTDVRVPILARMFGFVYTDGTLTYHKRDKTFTLQACFGCEYGAQQFEMDMALIGFDKRKIQLSSFKGSDYHTWDVAVVVGCLFFALGMTSGKKTTQMAKGVPHWILNGSEQVRREYLSGFQGGQGCQIRYNKMKSGSYNFVCAATLLSVSLEHQDSLERMMEDISVMFTHFNITNKIVKQMPKRYPNRAQIGIYLSNVEENLIRYYDTIGYRYDTRKIERSGIIIDYLKAKRRRLIERRQNVQEVRDLSDKGEEIIAPDFTTAQVADILRSYKNGRTISSLPGFTPELWHDKCQTKNGMLFVPLESVESVPTTIIADITTESDNHSFIASSGFCVHNSAMGKQAMGVYASNFAKRYDTNGHIMHYPQKPLVTTRVAKALCGDELPAGMQAIVAIMCFGGYNQEDSLLFNKSAVDRGFGRSTTFRTYSASNSSSRQAPASEFKKQDTYGSVNESLDFDGLTLPGTTIEKGNAIFCNVTPGKKYPHIVKNKKSGGVVDSTIMFQNANGGQTAKTRIREQRIPEMGDKFSSRHGQKGTIGMMYNQEDLPFTAEGIVPDLIVNPHAIPSRMTIGHVFECVASKLATLIGVRQDATAFSHKPVDEICKMLKKAGYAEDGKEVMYHPWTGKQLKARVFIGPTFYQKLKHMVGDKIHARAKGKIVGLTRQPVDGRANGGGLRWGEMERDCGVAHGASAVLHERMMISSDAYDAPLCEHCGLIGTVVSDDSGEFVCNSCHSSDVQVVKMPYAGKLLMQELMAMGVSPKIILKK